jgi:ATP-dependent Clp protease ATP-binding subunit ClpA
VALYLLYPGYTAVHGARVLEDLDLDLTKLSESGVRIVTRAEDEARRRGQDLMTSEHLFIAFAQVEWGLYARVMRDLNVRPDELLNAVEAALTSLPAVPGRPVRMTELTQELIRRAIQQAIALGREQAESYDVFAALLIERQSGPSLILRRFSTDGAWR